MKSFVTGNILDLMTALAVAVAIFTAAEWATMPVPQRMVALFFLALVLHLWEEGRFPGGFTDLITAKLNFTQIDPHFGETVTAILVIGLAFVPLFFPRVAFLAMAPMMLGILETVAHVAAIRIFRLKRFYSPGMFTALVLLMPIGVYGIAYAVRHELMLPFSWLISLLYVVGTLMLAQQIVVRASGMKYSQFLRNVKENVLDQKIAKK